MYTNVFQPRLTNEPDHIRISLPEVTEFWHYWLKAKYGDILGPSALKKIQDQGDYLIRQDYRYWADTPMTRLYNEALDRVETYWSHR